MMALPRGRVLLNVLTWALVIGCTQQTGTEGTHLTVRAYLVDGPSQYEGRVVITYNGTNGTVCDDSFGPPDVQVICRMLGFNSLVNYRPIFLFNNYGPGSGQIWLDEVACLGNETTIENCGNPRWGIHDCSHSEDVSLSCVEPGTFTTPPTNLMVQAYLVGGPTQYEGRVVITYNGTNGTICDDSFGVPDVRVICRMLGFNLLANYNPRFLRNVYGRGSGPIWLDEVACLGNETTIENCGNPRWGIHDCSHREDVSLSCVASDAFTTAPPITTTIDPQTILVYLVNGPNEYSGRVVITYNGVNGTVCDDGFGKNDARVLCRMAGFSGTQVELLGNQFGSGSGPIWLTNIRCNGRERSVLECLYNGWDIRSCLHSEDVSLSCGPNPRIQVYLVDGPNEYSGRIVMNFNGVNGTVCDDGFDVADARVMCRMAGFSGSRARFLRNAFGRGIGPIWLSNINCVGTEESVVECGYSGFGVTSCVHSEDVSISCAPPPSIQVYLVNGTNPYSGRVVINYDGVNGTVCDDGFSANDAQVICHMAGFRSTIGVRALGNQYGRGIGPIWLSNVGCSGSETSILQCSFSGWGISSCSHSEDISIACGPDANQVTVRLVNGADRLHGRIVLTALGRAGSICKGGFDEMDARVICRMLGYSGRYLSIQNYGGGSGRIWLDNVTCTGNEQHITQCGSHGWGTSNCSQSSAVGVNCGPTNVNIILQNGTNRSNGRLGVTLPNGTFGTVCEDFFDLNDARVACRYLGYGSNSVSLEYFGSGFGQILMDDLNCIGNETNLGLCSHAGWGYHDCTHNEDIGVNCRRVDYNVELRDGFDSRHGRIVIRRRGQLGTICNKRFRIQEAKVICRMLGYFGEEIGITSYGPGGGKIWIDSLQCLGTEDSIDNCHLIWGKESSCIHDEDVGLNCGPVAESIIQIRLVDGVDMYHGRAVLEFNGRQGTICRENFDQNDAKVLCRMLGYSGPDVSLQDYGPGSSEVLLEDVRCEGHESNILLCQYSGFGGSNCSHELDVGINCGASQIKVILEGYDYNHGRVLLQNNGEFGTVCDDSSEFHYRQARLAQVICRMNGFNGYDVGAWRYSGGETSNKTWIGNVDCRGNETSIFACRHRGWGLAPCNQSTNIAVNCGTPSVSGIRVHTEGGIDQYHGRVIVTYQGVQGTVCDQGFGENEARAICWMLNYFGNDITISSYGPGTGRILLRDLDCGDSIHISSCKHPGWGFVSNCTHNEDVGISCGPIVVPENTRTVLEGGKDRFHGRVNFEYGTERGIICEGSSTLSTSKTRLAVVLCRMTGYSGSDVEIWQYTANETAKVWFRNMRCNGDEANLKECVQSPAGLCNHTQAVGVTCGISLSDITVRLVDGPDNLHGRVIVNYYGLDGTICDDSFSVTDAQTICWMAGYIGSDVRVTQKYGEGSGYIWLDGMDCPRGVDHIGKCTHQGWSVLRRCNHYEDVGIDCGPIMTENITVRLEDGIGSLDGRVVLTNKNIDGAICTTGIDLSDAIVICAMLGYNGTDVSLYQIDAGIHHIWLNNIHCNGTESHIAECATTGWGNRTCFTNKIIGIRCGINQNASNGESRNATQALGVCGSRFTSKIYGGTSATRPWPWMVSIQFTRNNSHNCGGSIIAPRWILTAAHCFRSNDPLTYTIIAGTNVISRTSRTTTGTTLRIDKIIRHPDYQNVRFSLTRLLLDQDIALVKLEEELRYTSTIQPLCLSAFAEIPTGPCYVAGWGYTSNSRSRPTRLQETVFPIVSSYLCEGRYPYFDSSINVCAGYSSGRRDLCLGDSGSPIVCRRPGTDVYDQYGLFSYSLSRCGRDTYTVHTKVFTFSNWINQVTAEDP